jgi:hypothetical protein
MIEAKLKHLEMIQLVISRMANNSFLLKGWSVTLTAAIFALAAKDADRSFFIVTLLPVIMFWGLDAYFLHQERLFRKLYDHVRCLPDGQIDFSMNISIFIQQTDGWIKVAFSKTLLFFHFPIIFIISIFIYLK